MIRPVIKIELEPIDWIIEIIAFIGLLLLVALPVYYYNNLPNVIPQHYNLIGEPDGIGGKGKIWLVPVTGLIIYVGLLLLNKSPHIFNYPKKITPENAKSQYRSAIRLIRLLKAIIVCVFCYISYVTILTALQKQDGLPNYFAPAFIILIFGIIGFYLFKTSVINTKKQP